MSRNQLLALLTLATLSLFGPETQSAPRDNVILFERLRQSTNLMNLQPATAQDAIDSASYDLKRTQQIDLAVSFDEVLMDTVANEYLKAAGSDFSRPHFKLSRQTISVKLDYAGGLDVPGFEKAQIQAVLAADLSPRIALTSDATNSEVRVRFAVSALQVKNLKTALGGRALGPAVDKIAQKLANQILTPARDLLSSFEVRVPTGLAAKINIPPSKQSDNQLTVDH